MFNKNPTRFSFSSRVFLFINFIIIFKTLKEIQKYFSIIKIF